VLDDYSLNDKHLTPFDLPTRAKNIGKESETTLDFALRDGRFHQCELSFGSDG
jgi:hypothetical protein